jgi:plastocyanin
MLGLVCALLVVVLVLSYGAITVLGNGHAPAPVATATPSGQLTAASPTVAPTLAPTPVPTHKPKPTPTHKAVATPTRAPTPTPTPKPRPVTVHIKMTNAGYSPGSKTIPVGSTVIWTNDGGIAHTVTATSGPVMFDSGNMDPGATFQYTFTKPGTYEYDCQYHPYMTGTIIVQ